jgi:hypothetical protein
MTLIHSRQIWEVWVKVETSAVSMKSNSRSFGQEESGRE